MGFTLRKTLASQGMVVAAALGMLALTLGGTAWAQTEPNAPNAPSAAAGTTRTETTVITIETEPAEKPVAGYDGAFFVRNPKGPDELFISGFAKPLYTYKTFQNYTDEPDQTHFSLPEARFMFEGHVLSKALFFRLQTNMALGRFFLLDYFIDYTFAPGDLILRVGQFKRPFDRNKLIKNTKRLMVEFPITEAVFGAGRDMGIMIHNGRNEELSYALAFLNGTGIFPPAGQVTNVPTRFKPQAIFRLGYTQPGMDGYDSVDLKDSPLGVAAAISGIADFNIDDKRSAKLAGEFDAIVKGRGFSALLGVFVNTRQNGAEWTTQEFDGFGSYLETTYVIEKVFGPTGRFSVVTIKDGPTARDTTYEASLGFNAYFFGHKLEWKNQGRILFSTGSRRAYAGYTQLQFVF